MEHSIALVTGATSGLGYAAAKSLAEEGWREIIVTGRSLSRAQETVAQIAAETKTHVFAPLELDLNAPASVQSVLATLVKRGRAIDFLLLNAGLVPGKARVITAAGVEAAQAPLIGHHQLTAGLLRANLLSPNARIVIAGAEPARGGVPMFKYTDAPAFAAKYFRGDRTAAVEALIRNGPNVKYAPNNTYADAKLIIAWWVAALARRLPSGMAVYAVSPGAATATKVVRNAGPALKYLFIPIANLIPGRIRRRRPRPVGTSRRRSSEPTSQGSSSPRLKGSSQAQLRRSASHTSTIAPARKPRGRPSSRSPASICQTRHPYAHRCRRHFEINSSKRS
jgi:NAD(P)-dependent dehydrogenase (short-subunit alcohol dehydrogenase family)